MHNIEYHVFVSLFGWTVMGSLKARFAWSLGRFPCERRRGSSPGPRWRPLWGPKAPRWPRRDPGAPPRRTSQGNRPNILAYNGKKQKPIMTIRGGFTNWIPKRPPRADRGGCLFPSCLVPSCSLLRRCLLRACFLRRCDLRGSLLRGLDAGSGLGGQNYWKTALEGEGLHS